MASPAFATSIGLVIVGIDRYEKERERLKSLEPEPAQPEEPTPSKKSRKKEKEPRQEGKKFTEVFLEKIKNWFEEENE